MPTLPFTNTSLNYLMGYSCLNMNAKIPRTFNNVSGDSIAPIPISYSPRSRLSVGITIQSQSQRMCGMSSKTEPLIQLCRPKLLLARVSYAYNDQKRQSQLKSEGTTRNKMYKTVNAPRIFYPTSDGLGRSHFDTKICF